MLTSLRTLLRLPAIGLFAAGLVLLLGSGLLWYYKVYLAPRTVFDAMLARNLATSAVVIRQTSREINGVKLDKRTDVVLGAQNRARIKATTIALGSGTTVVTETVSDRERELNRYAAIRQGKDEVPLDTSAVVDKWAEGSGGATAFAQSLLRPYGLPMGLLPAAPRRELLGYLRDNEVFQVDYAARRGSFEGRPVYTYEVRVQPVPYITFLKSYAGALRLDALKDVQPAAARQTPPVPVRLTVDIASRRLVAADYPSLGYRETYSDYNVPRRIEIPKAQISGDELQRLVGELR